MECNKLIKNNFILISKKIQSVLWIYKKILTK